MSDWTVRWCIDVFKCYVIAVLHSLRAASATIKDNTPSKKNIPSLVFLQQLKETVATNGTSYRKVLWGKGRQWRKQIPSLHPCVWTSIKQSPRCHISLIPKLFSPTTGTPGFHNPRPLLPARMSNSVTSQHQRPGGFSALTPASDDETPF